MTNPYRASLARRAAGLTQGGLARRLGVTQPFISQVERGERNLPPSTAEAWAAACGVRPDFFDRPENPLDTPATEMLHRRLASLPAKSFQRAISSLKVAMLALDDLWSEVAVEPANVLPTAPPGMGPADAAAALRRQWRVPSGPLPNLTALVESAGIPVLHTFSLHEKHSGASHRGSWLEWAIALNADHPASRQRFSLAHELGHIVLGHDASPVDDDFENPRALEDAADAFAAALLIPEDDARRELRNLDFRRLVLLKSRWRVSIAMLIRRAFDLDLISPQQRKILEIQLSTRPGGRRREDAEFEREDPSLVRSVIGALEADGRTWPELAELTSLHEDSIREWLLAERPKLRAVGPASPRSGPVLRLVPPGQSMRS